MKKIMMMAVAALMSLSAMAQIDIYKFGFVKDSPFGMSPDCKGTELNFRLDDGKPVKYVKVYYVAVNKVGDFIHSTQTNQIEDGFDLLGIECTGPFKPGKKYKRWSSGTFFYPEKKIYAVPTIVKVIYSDNSVFRLTAKDKGFKDLFSGMKWDDIFIDFDTMGGEFFNEEDFDKKAEDVYENE